MHGAAERHNLVIKAIEEICEIHDGAVGEKTLFDAGVEADAFLRLQFRIVGKGQFKAVRGSNARAEASVNPCPAKNAVRDLRPSGR